MSGGWPKPGCARRGKRAAQLTFAERRGRNGKPRKRPGRKPAERQNVRHYVRPRHSRWVPMHITMRAERGLPDFRSQVAYPAFEQAIRLTRRPDFRIIEFSVQSTHLHLNVEAESTDALARGMKSFSVRANRRFNAAVGRGRGRVWSDRYHREDLTTPRPVRTALVYCINNYKKHFGAGIGKKRIDFCSSARWFTGWNAKRSSHDGPRPTPLATIPLLAWIWHDRHGLIDPGESPKRRAG